jgi:hypothetical protein
VKVATELFRRMVAFERATRAPVLAVIKERIWALMDSRERTCLFSALVGEFLSRPESKFSQKSVVDSLDALGLPAGDLILFLVSSLGLGHDLGQGIGPAEGCAAPEKPLVMVSSILVLTIRELKRSTPADRGVEGKAGEPAFLRALGKRHLRPRTATVTKEGPKVADGVGNEVGQDEAAHNPKGGRPSSGAESGEMTDELEALEPLQPQRSFSVPISGPKGGDRRPPA